MNVHVRTPVLLSICLWTVQWLPALDIQFLLEGSPSDKLITCYWDPQRSACKNIENPVEMVWRPLKVIRERDMELRYVKFLYCVASQMPSISRDGILYCWCC